MDNHLIKWNTGRLISPHLKDLLFFEGFKGINKDLFDLYEEVKVYSQQNYSDPASTHSRYFGFGEKAYGEWIEYLDKVLEFQKFVVDDKKEDKGAVAKKALEVFDNKDVGEAYIADLQMLKKLETLLEYSESVRHLFNFIVPLYKPHAGSMTPELEAEILEVIENKGLSSFEIPADLLNVNQNVTLS